MLNDFWILCSSLFIFIGGLVSSEGLLLVVGSLVLVLAIAGRIWDHFAFCSVSHSRSISTKRAVIGDTIEYSVTLDNDKVLPIMLEFRTYERTGRSWLSSWNKRACSSVSYG